MNGDDRDKKSESSVVGGLKGEELRIHVLCRKQQSAVKKSWKGMNILGIMMDYFIKPLYLLKLNFFVYPIQSILNMDLQILPHLREIREKDKL